MDGAMAAICVLPALGMVSEHPGERNEGEGQLTMEHL